MREWSKKIKNNNITNMSNEQSDLTTRVKSFNEELIALLGKYKLGLGATPLMNGNPVNDAFREMYNIQARPQVFDDVKPGRNKGRTRTS